MQQKNAAFEEYETHTRALLECDIDDIEGHISRRGVLCGKIDQLEESIRAACAQTSQPQKALLAVRSRCDRGDLPQDLAPVFDAALEISGIIARIQGLEKEVQERLEQERDGLREKIKEHNQSSQAKASKYVSGVQTANVLPSGSTRLGKA